jgi:excisionase family DNA binding protein
MTRLMTLMTTLTIPQRLAEMKGGITATALAKLLGVSSVSIYKLASKNAIPSYRVGTSLRFDPAAVAKWLETSE